VAWYREWFGEEYLGLYAHRDAEEAAAHVDFVARVLGEARPRAVLDLACGTGRHTAPLVARGVRACGVDLSLTLLGFGRGLPRVRGDMRRLPFAGGTFDWVLNFFTSFGYFESERENLQVLEEVARVLAPGGALVLDLFNIDRVLAELRERETVTSPGRRIEIERSFDAASRRLLKRMRVELAGRPPRTFVESVRAYREEEVAAALAGAGLAVAARFGDFTGERFHRDSERLIFVARRPA